MNTSTVVILLVYVFVLCNSQAPRTFNCAAPSLCLDVVIDPRAGTPELQTNIVSPNAPLTDCPSGTIRCNSVKCGTPSVPVSQASGLATQNSLPWQAYLRDDLRNAYVGGGVLIDQYNVLTAAHKISNLTAAGASMSVLMGVYNPQTIPQPPVQVSKVLRAYKHSDYNERLLKNDVAILRLSTPMALTSTTMTMCLPAAGSNFVTTPPTSCLVAGWGQTGFTTFDAPTTTLKQVYVPIVSGAECKNSFQTQLQGQLIVADYLDVDNGNEICAGGQSQLDSCTQDGGSPLICKNPSGAYNLAGLVLWGKGCGEANRYGVYLNVPNYLSWIQSTAQCSTQNSAVCARATTQNFN